MRRDDTLIEQITEVASEPPQQVIGYDEHVCEVLYAGNDTVVPIVGEDETALVHELSKRHHMEPPSLGNEDVATNSHTYHTDEFVAVQIPLGSYRGILISFPPTVTFSLQRLHTQVQEWNQDRHEWLNGTRDTLGGAVSLLPSGARTIPEASIMSAQGCCACLLACSCCLPV